MIDFNDKFHLGSSKPAPKHKKQRLNKNIINKLGISKIKNRNIKPIVKNDISINTDDNCECSVKLPCIRYYK